VFSSNNNVVVGTVEECAQSSFLIPAVPPSTRSKRGWSKLVVYLR